MTKAKALERIEELKNYVDGLDNYEGWEPKYGNKYYFIDSVGGVDFTTWWGSDRYDMYRLIRKNVFKTEDEAYRWCRIDQTLHETVWKLNQEKPVDWENEEAPKYYLYLGTSSTVLESSNYFNGSQGVLYCSKPFRKILLKTVSKEDLNWYVRRKTEETSSRAGWDGWVC